MDRKLNILYICVDPSRGGSTTSLYYLIDSLKKEVNPIVLFPVKDQGYDFFVQNGIESYAYPFVRLQHFHVNSLKNVWPHVWRWHYIRKIRFDVGSYRYIKKILAGRNIDIVHSNTSPNDIGVLLARKLKAKHVWHVREFCDLDFHFDIYRGLPRLRKLINTADARIAISSAIKTHWHMPEEHTWIINNAIRSKNDACYIPNKEKYLLFSSYYLTESKGTHAAIIAFAKSGIKNEGYQLLLMGNCTEEYKEYLLSIVHENKLENHVKFIPCQKDVKPYFALATAYLMMSDFEALGRVTAEAMFFGCPVIAHASGGTLDMVKQNETGYLYNTIDECAALIKQVCEEPQEELILRAQKYAINNLSQEVYGPKIMEVYRTILNN